MELEKNEQIILDNGCAGFREKLTLTNKRLMVQKGKGLFSVTWAKKEEIPLDEIDEAYAHVESFTALSALMIKLKNGETREFRFKLGDTQMLGASLSSDMGTGIVMRVKFIVDRWVSAINNVLKK